MSADKLYDLEQLQNIHGDEAFTKMILSTFIESIPQNAKELVDASGAEDWTKVHFLAHKIKSSIALLNMHTITEEVKKVEHDAKNKTGLHAIPSLALHIHATIVKASAQMKEDFGL